MPGKWDCRCRRQAALVQHALRGTVEIRERGSHVIGIVGPGRGEEWHHVRISLSHKIEQVGNLARLLFLSNEHLWTYTSSIEQNLEAVIPSRMSRGIQLCDVIDRKIKFTSGK